MIINQLNFYLYNQPFKSPIVTPKVKLETRKTLVIEFIDNHGDAYFGECNAFQTQWYDNETIDSVKENIKQWYDRIKNKEMSTFKEWQSSLELLNDYPAARCTIMMAIYQKYYKLESFKVPYGATVNGMTEIQLNRLAQTQPKRIKLKYSNQLISDIDNLQSLSFSFDLAIDANESLNLTQYQSIIENIDHDILYIEEPFQSLDDIKRINGKPYPPIALDEKATSTQEIKNIISEYPIEVVILKPFRLGGIDRVLDAIQTLHKEGVKVVIGGMYEYGLSRYFTAMLAQHGDYPGDVTPMGYYFENDFVENEGILKEGMIEFNPPVVNRTKLECINDDCV